MKKELSILSILFALFLLHLPSYAAITNDDLTSEKYIINHGYSGETARLIDLQRAQINGTTPTYKGKETWYADKLSNWFSEKQVNFVRKSFIYFDDGLDDGKFMQHDTKFTNRWDDW